MDIIKLMIYFVIFSLLVLFFYNFGFSSDNIVKYIEYGALGTSIILIFDELGQ